MLAQHVPRINSRYWSGITLASIFGTNLGDFYAHTAGLGIGLGLAVLAVLCALVFIVERIDRSAHEVYYWLVIIIIRTGATNIADYTAYRLRIPELLLNGGLILLLAVLAIWQERSTPFTSGSATRVPVTGVSYWIAMLTAGVLGTVLGDVCEHAVGEGVAALGLLAILIAVLLSRAPGVGTLYWLIVAVARTAGTAIGDWVAENHIFNIGLPYSTVISGLLFVGVLLLWRPRATARPPMLRT